MNQGLLTAAPGPPALDIKANGQDDALFVTPETPISLTISFDPGYRENLNADWWIAVDDNADGVPDVRWVDRVDVDMTCWR